MVLTQLQLKWPNHSTHLLTRLTYLYKNEQLVDCTLMCNKHSLRVHKSVLAACSPYFERELENNPLIVVEDMQFNVLQALIEFMYYGETRITEENLTSLVEAAKLFEVKGLSEMDVLTSNNTNVVSVAMAEPNNYNTDSSSSNKENFGNNAQSFNPILQSDSQQQPIPNENHVTHFDEEQNHNAMDIGSCQPHSNRNFVVTPPQTESAQILLSLARSYSQKQFNSEAVNDSEFLKCEKQINNHCSINDNILFNNSNLILNELPNTSSASNITGGKLPLIDMVARREEVELLVQQQTPSTPPPSSLDGSKSLLAKLLTRGSETQSTSSKVRYDEQYKNLYNVEKPAEHNDVGALEKSKTTNVDLSTGIILECPFLIETNDGGYVDVSVDSVENMLNVFENGEYFDANNRSIKVISREELEHMQAQEQVQDISCSTEVRVEEQPEESTMNDVVLECIKQDTVENDFKEDPEAVVLCRVNAEGKMEKFTLSSADIEALREMNVMMREKNAAAASSSSQMTEFRIPVSDSDTPLITQIMDCGSRIENVISRLPFKRSGYLDLNFEVKSEGVSGGRMPLDTTLPVDAHHHENMFEELDNQFNMDCSIENIQRDYVAYEEASKNETQLDHNYYANAMKDEDEECVVISDNYDLRMMMMVEEETDVVEDPNATAAAVTIESATDHKKNNNTYQIIRAQDVYLNGSLESAAGNGQWKENGQRNGIIATATDKGMMILNGKYDLVLDNDALMSSVLNVAGKTKQRVNGVSKSIKTLKNADLKQNLPNTLPFKSVKSTTTFKNTQIEKKSRRSYRRKSNSQSSDTKPNENMNLNGGFCNENSLMEEIIVDEIS